MDDDEPWHWISEDDSRLEPSLVGFLAWAVGWALIGFAVGIAWPPQP